MFAFLILRILWVKVQFYRLYPRICFFSSRLKEEVYCVCRVNNVQFMMSPFLSKIWVITIIARSASLPPSREVGTFFKFLTFPHRAVSQAANGSHRKKLLVIEDGQKVLLGSHLVITVDQPVLSMNSWRSSKGISSLVQAEAALRAAIASSEHVVILWQAFCFFDVSIYLKLFLFSCLTSNKIGIEEQISSMWEVKVKKLG